MKTRAFNLMKEWCDRLIDFKVDSASKYLDGALLCPACHAIHGRIADLVFPLTTLWAQTKDSKYLDAAKKLVEWTEFNLRRPDGSYYNDAGSTWKGITAFSTSAIGESLFYYGDMLPADLFSEWKTIFIRLSDFCYTFFDTASPNINYFAGAAAALALAWKLTGEKKYLDKANYWENFCRGYFDEQGLFYGEGKPHDILTEKGCRAIDMGYNLEESLPLLLRHSVLLNDAEKLAFYKARLLDHLEFLLPDGAIDNSFGSRHNKWTYWGSRTSDGIIEGLALVLDEPVFAKACDCALTLYERCTKDGLLAMPMASEAGEPTCIHHTFCHAKALAALVNESEVPEVDHSVLLPREKIYGVKAFQNGNVLLVSNGGWRATYSACDIVFYRGAENGGGSMTLLWNEKTGPICAATMETYIPSEPHNMQYLRNSDDSLCMTPRLIIDGKSSLLDKNVKLSSNFSNESVEITASSAGWKVVYSFIGDELKISVESNKPSKFILPIISPRTETVKSIYNEIIFPNGVRVTTDSTLNADTMNRCFNQVPGFDYLPIEIEVDSKAEIKLTLK